MATAQSYEVNIDNPSIPELSTDLDDAHGNGTGKSIWAALGKYFGGYDMEQAYQNMLTENNRAYEKALLKEQRAYDEYVRNREYEREDTKMQRLMKDYKAAGLNPWLALQGGISGSTAQSQPASNSSFERGSSAKSKEDKSSSGALSGLLIAVAKVIATL